ncbi:hypothetical protein ABMA28_006355 [Loxostege sticticalis]|uniref:Gag protein n=1 Tax=Loxostege sticticalis TaxID=481309 RepID=A0ABD0SKY3_LOXSC
MTRSRKSRNASLLSNDGEDRENTFTESAVTALIARLQQSQTEAFERLIDRVMADRTVPAPQSSTPSTFVAPSDASATFARCTARYGGGPGESLENFLDAVESFKECAGVSDFTALRGLSMLLTHNAATWWQGVRESTQTWKEAKESLVCAFGEQRPTHRIYRLLFNEEQGIHERTDIFVAKARALLAKLPRGDLNTKVELDMVYGLLNNKIRERIARSEITSFDELIRRARELEDEMMASPAASYNSYDRELQARAGRSAHATLPARVPAPRSSPPLPHDSCATDAAQQPSTATDDVTATATDATRLRRPDRYCNYCKRYGHTRDVCRKLIGESLNSLNFNSIDPKNKLETSAP